MKRLLPIAVICCCIFILAQLQSCALMNNLGRKQQEQQEQPVYQIPAGAHIALLLPQKGAFAPIGEKIITGARMATANLSKQGQIVHLKVIYTDKQWETALKNLPPYYSLVGGPLEKNVYERALQAGYTKERAFFTFLGRLPRGEEGEDAWRFFLSAEDQADAIARACVKLGIHSVGALTPADEKSQSITDLVAEKLRKRGISFRKVSYDANTPSLWSASAQALLKPSSSESKAPLEAVFLPENWNRIPSLLDILQRQGGKGLVVFGSSVWAGRLTHATPDAASYPLLVFPSFFIQDMASRPLSGGRYDGWHALGYDFIRFAARMNIHARYSSAQVSTRASQAAMMNYSMAPMSYSQDGRAHQKLFLLQPGTIAAGLMNVANIQGRRSAILATPESENPLVPNGEQMGLSPFSTPAYAAPASQSQYVPKVSAPSSSKAKPYSSYKLRLPSAAQ